MGVAVDVAFNLTTATPHAVAHSLRAEVQAIATPEPMTLAIRGREGGGNLEAQQDGLANAVLTPNGGRAGMGVGAIAFAQNQRDELREMDRAGALAAEPGMKQQTYVRDAWAVRRLTPTECARLQGFPDDYLDIAFRNRLAADGNKYKALGNSMAVPCIGWVLQRVADAMPVETRIAA